MEPGIQTMVLRMRRIELSPAIDGNFRPALGFPSAICHQGNYGNRSVTTSGKWSDG